MKCPDCGNEGYDEEHGYCSICDIVEVEEEKTTKTGIEEFDECPNCESRIDFDGTYCDRCHYGYTPEELVQIYIEEQYEAAEKAYDSNPTLISPKEDLITYIEKTLNEKMKNAIDPNYVHMLAVFLSSLSLNRVVFPDGLGHIRPNLYCFVIGRSGTFKSPLINFIDRGSFNGFNRMQKSSDFTPEALYEMAYSWSRLHPNEPYPLLSAIDEMSTLLKNASNGGFKSNLPEVLCKAFDNKIEGSDSKGDLRIGIKKQTIAGYHCLIGASTDHFLKLADDSWWISGLFNRALWVYVDSTKMPLLTSEDMVRVYEDIDPQFFKTVNERLTKLQTYANVVFKKDSPGYLKWTEWSSDILNKNRIDDSYLSVYKTKQLTLCFKLACIYAASRDSIDVNDSIVIELQDVDRAITDIENVWFPQADETIKRWRYVTGNEEQTIEDKVVSWINLFLDTHKGDTLEKGRIYSVTGEKVEKSVIFGSFERNNRGEWVKKSDLLHLHRSKSNTTEKLNRFVNEAIKAGLIEEGQDVSTKAVYLRTKSNFDVDEAFEDNMKSFLEQ